MSIEGSMCVDWDIIIAKIKSMYWNLMKYKKIGRKFKTNQKKGGLNEENLVY